MQPGPWIDANIFDPDSNEFIDEGLDEDDAVEFADEL